MDLQSIEREALQELDTLSALADVEKLYTKYLGRKEGSLTQILRGLGSLTPEEKKSVGQAANVLRTLLEERFSAKQKQLRDSTLTQEIEKKQIDTTLPGQAFPQGHSHPISRTIQEIS